MATTREHAGVVLAIILVGYAMAVLDVSIVMVALPRIKHDLGFSPTGLSWVHNAYALAFGGLLLVGARAGDLLGRRACSSPGSQCSPPPRWPPASRSRPAG